MHRLIPRVTRPLVLLAAWAATAAWGEDTAAPGPARDAATGQATDATKPPDAKARSTPERSAAKQARACHACGGTGGLVPVCHCAPETRKRAHTTYDIRCEPVCVPGGGGGLRGGGACGCGGSSGTIRMKKTLVKKVTDEEVRGVKHEVRFVCRHCAGGDRGGCPTCTGFIARAPADGAASRWAGWLDLFGVR
jgi:hypothetical protein